MPSSEEYSTHTTGADDSSDQSILRSNSTALDISASSYSSANDRESKKSRMYKLSGTRLLWFVFG